MKGRNILIASLVIVFSLILTGIGLSEDIVSIKGKVKTIDLKINTVVITTQEGQDVTVTVDDKTTLAKFRDGRISEGDEVKVKYKTINGKNISTYFKKAAGC